MSDLVGTQIVGFLTHRLSYVVGRTEETCLDQVHSPLLSSFRKFYIPRARNWP